MPWKESHVSSADLRLVLVHQVAALGRSMAEVCREHGVSRKTGYKWLARYRQAPQQPLANASSRPHRCPKRTSEEVESRVIALRAKYGWGARKIRKLLDREGLTMPSIVATHAVLRRHGLICAATTKDRAPPPQFFERPLPNELWQCDHKGPLEIARQKVYPLSVLDDHSRFALAVRPCLELSMTTAFSALWEVFGEFGLPTAILCDNAYATRCERPQTLSWFEARLIRLHIQPLHGHPYHPQTQGKVERFHGTLEREVWPRIRRDTLEHFSHDLEDWRMNVYNTLRPHEALADQPPISRFRKSTRPRPDELPPVEYPAGSVLRKVSTSGDIHWRNCRILAGRGLVGELVRIEEREHDLAVFYSWKQIRCLPHSQLTGDNML
jgi:transposase InsO family protein